MKLFLKFIITAVILYMYQLLFPNLFYFKDISSILLTAFMKFIISSVAGIIIAFILAILLTTDNCGILISNILSIIIQIVLTLILFIFLDTIVFRYMSNTYEFFTFYGNNIQLFIFTFILNIFTIDNNNIKRKEEE